MKRLPVTSRASEGVDTTELEKRIQQAFNRYKAGVSIKDKRKGISVRISLVSKANLTTAMLKEMYAKIDHMIDGTYADIFELRAAWVEARKDAGLDLVMDYVFEGEESSLKEIAATMLDYDAMIRAFRDPSTPSKVKKHIGVLLKIQDKAGPAWQKIYDMEAKWARASESLEDLGYYVSIRFRDLGA